MKTIFFIISFLFSISCLGQTYTAKTEVERINNLKKTISREVDDFTDEIQIHSNLLSIMALWKEITPTGHASYTIRLKTYGNTLNIGEKGVIVLFEDGTKWHRNTEISVDPDDYNWKYTSYIDLYKKDLDLFSSKKVKKFRLYIYDQPVSEMFAEEFINIVKIIRDMK